MTHSYWETGKVTAEGTSAGVVKLKIASEGGGTITTLDLPPDSAEAFGQELIAKAKWVREHVTEVKK